MVEIIFIGTEFGEDGGGNTDGNVGEERTWRWGCHFHAQKTDGWRWERVTKAGENEVTCVTGYRRFMRRACLLNVFRAEPNFIPGALRTKLDEVSVSFSRYVSLGVAKDRLHSARLAVGLSSCFGSELSHDLTWYPMSFRESRSFLVSLYHIQNIKGTTALSRSSSIAYTPHLPAPSNHHTRSRRQRQRLSPTIRSHQGNEGFVSLWGLNVPGSVADMKAGLNRPSSPLACVHYRTD